MTLRLRMPHNAFGCLRSWHINSLVLMHVALMFALYVRVRVNPGGGGGLIPIRVHKDGDACLDLGSLGC